MSDIDNSSTNQSFQNINPDSTLSTQETLSSQIITHLTYGGFWRRFFAGLIDGIITWAIGLPLSYVIGTDMILGATLGFIIHIVYQTVFLTSDIQTTPGRSVLGLVVINEDTQATLTFKASLIREIGSYISAMMAMLGYLIQPFTSKRQTFHDMIAGSIVVRKGSDVDVNYVKVFINQFKKLINN